MVESAGLQDVIRSVRSDLIAAGVDNALPEARRLVVEAAGLCASKAISEPGLRLDEAQLARVSDWSRRRCANETLARIRGWQEFYGRRFGLTAHTLEPRADSEVLIRAALSLVDESRGRAHAWRILDVGTGTGCLAITLLAELPNATAVGSDVSPGALNAAAANAKSLEVQDRSEWIRADGLDALPGQFDILISNPPYVAAADVDRLQPEVRLNDPRLALDGGADGLAMYRQIAEGLDRVVPNGLVILETADDDCERVVSVFEGKAGQAGVYRTKVWHDLTGRGRCVTFQTRA